MAGRRFGIYFAWSRPQEIAGALGTLENRFPTLFEFRRTIWPHYEWAKDPSVYQQDISGFLDHVILFDFARFIEVVQNVTGQRVTLLQREHEDTKRFLLDDKLLSDIDSLIVVSLDHLRTEQEATDDEASAVARFLERESTCLFICPHHDVGITGEAIDARLAEHTHHGDPLVPSQQRIGGFARSLLARIGLPIENRFGLHPAGAANDANLPAALETFRDLDPLNILQGVPTFNLHPHLPHLHIPDAYAHDVVVLARQPINMRAPLNAEQHPYISQGNRFFNALLFAPPKGRRAGTVFVCDATLWSAAFGGVASLEAFWRNLANMRT